MPLDLTPFNRLQFKASHNSYARDEDLHEQLVFIAQSPSEGGCRGLELDIVRRSDASAGRSLTYFQVSHSRSDDGPPLAAYLGYLLSFHANHPQHDPILVTLDIKSEAGDLTLFPDEIDNYLREWFDEKLLVKPANLMRDRDLDLAANVARYGWPELGQIRSLFCFCLSGTEDWKSFYANHRIADRLCFSDFDCDDDDPGAGIPPGNRVFANLHLYSAHDSIWKQTVPRLRAANIVVRGYELNGATIWTRAMAAGVNVLTTDKVTGETWASVGPGRYRLA